MSRTVNSLGFFLKSLNLSSQSGPKEACSNPADAESIPGVATPSGDVDHNGRVDLDDFGMFPVCYGGPDVGVGLACRCAYDFNLDNDVDMEDFASFQIAFTGP